MVLNKVLGNSLGGAKRLVGLESKVGLVRRTIVVLSILHPTVSVIGPSCLVGGALDS